MKSPLALKIALSLIVAICITMGSYTYFNIKYIAKKMESDAEKGTRSILHSTVPIIADGLWDLDPHTTQTALEQTLRNPIITKAIVFHEDGSPFSTIQRETKDLNKTFLLRDFLNEKDIQNMLKQDLLHPENDFYVIKHTEHKQVLLAHAIYKKNKNENPLIGYLIMEYSDQYIADAIYAEIIKTLLLAVYLAVATILMSFLFIKKFVLTPYIAEQKEQQRMADELETARIVQKSLLPEARNLQVGSFEISAFYKSASECGGDWWHFYPLSHNKILIMIGDVTGHGTPSAILAAVIKGYCDSIYTKPEITSAQILSELDFVIQNSGSGNLYMTMFAAVLDPERHTINFSNAGQNFPYLIRASIHPATVQPLIVTGKRLGEKETEEELNLKNSTYQSKTEKFSPHDILFLYTDGFLSARNKIADNLYTTRQLEKSFIQIHNKSTAEILDVLLADLKSPAGLFDFDDDLTLVTCRLS